MEIIQDPKLSGNATFVGTAAEWLARDEQQRQQAREHFQGNPGAAAIKLYTIATQPTSGGRAASALLLSLWNDYFVCNLRDVLVSLDISNTEAALALLNTLGPGHHLERYLTDDQIMDIIDVWGETHQRRRATR